MNVKNKSGIDGVWIKKKLYFDKEKAFKIFFLEKKHLFTYIYI